MLSDASMNHCGDMFGVSKSTVRYTIGEVSYLISSKLKDAYIRMLTTALEIQEANARFHRIGQFAMAIGAVDDTQIKITSLGGPEAELYRDRKRYFSFNCQMVASAEVHFNYQFSIKVCSS